MEIAAQHFETIVSSLADPDQPKATFRAIDSVCREISKTILFTILKNHPEDKEIERVFTSDDSLYQVGQRKSMGGTPWGASVLDRGETWLGRDIEANRAVFPDWEKFVQSGLGSAICVPIRWEGRSLGIISLAGPEGAYSLEDEPALRLLASFLPAAMLKEPTN